LTGSLRIHLQTDRQTDTQSDENSIFAIHFVYLAEITKLTMTKCADVATW